MSKIAICFFGKVGNIKTKSGLGKSDMDVLLKSFEHYDRHILNKNNIDVFIHCWDIELKERILKLYKPKSFIIEKQRFFNIPWYVLGNHKRKQNHYSRWYSQKISNDLRSSYEKENNFKYDFVMSTRFDIAFEKDLIFSEMDSNLFYAPSWDIALNKKGKDIFKGGKNNFYEKIKNNPSLLNECKYSKKGYPFTNSGLADLWFIGNSKDSTAFSKLFDYLDNYNKPLNCPYGGGKILKMISNHQLSLYHIKKIDLLKKLRFKFNRIYDFPLTRRKYFNCKN